MPDFRCPKCNLQVGNVKNATCAKHGVMERPVWSVSTTRGVWVTTGLGFNDFQHGGLSEPR